MTKRRTVEYLGQAERDIPGTLQSQLRADLENVFRAQQAQAITVSRCYAGYAGPSPEKIVLGVEVRLPGSFETHIVKIGSEEKVAADFKGWQSCLQGRDFASRIFLPVRRHDLPAKRVAIIYQDAYTLFGLGPAQRPESLETVIEWSMRDDRPDPVSIERAIAHIYTDLSRWMYYRAEERPTPARAFYERRLRKSLKNWSENTADPEQKEHARQRWELRRDAIWLLCGADKPDGDKPAEYLDPHDWVSWAVRNNRVPRTLVGPSHGDLHGRNVLLGVQRGEVEYPAVFDYGEMSPDNVLVWDFVKLETELKVRLLPVLYQDESCREALLKHSKRIRRPAGNSELETRNETGSSFRAPGSALGAEDVVDDQARRADRLEFAFQFERLLAERTAWIQGKADAEARNPPGGRAVTKMQKLDRLFGILLRVRQEAALWLGYERGRKDLWQEEYYFGLAVYGLVHARPDWDYEPRQGECALISAGVAAARAAPEVIKNLIEDDRPLPADYPSYHVPLALIHKRWQARKIDEALKIVNRVLPAKHSDSHRAGRGSPDPALPATFEHAVPLIAEHALLLAEEGRHREAGALLLRLRKGCRIFGDVETLCRIGRAYKDRGDEEWNRNAVHFNELKKLPAWQMYQHALAAYHDAFEFSSGYYPGINAASLALLVGEVDQAKKIARRVSELCAARREGLDGEEAIWVFATEGEAALILGEKSAGDFYSSALNDLGPQQSQIAQSMYNQLCRLWQALGPKAVDPVVRVFQESEAWSRLGKGPVGDCGGRIKNRHPTSPPLAKRGIGGVAKGRTKRGKRRTT